MPDAPVPPPSRLATKGMVCAADQQAAAAGARMIAAGGSAADAAVAAGAVMAVTSPHVCGMGGDVLAVVRRPSAGEADVLALLGAGRAGSGAGAAADALRAEGKKVMPLWGDIRSVTVPGAVDGWLALHARLGRLPLSEVMAPAIALAEDGFVAGALLTAASRLVAQLPGAEQLCPEGPMRAPQVVRLPGIARSLRAVVEGGRDAFYGGEFGRALLELGQGLYEPADLADSLADWVEPLRLRAFGHDLWTVPAPSQGYLTLAGAYAAEAAGLPADPSDPRWPHLLVEACRATGHDRPEVLHDGAEGALLLAMERLAARAGRIDPDRAAPPDVPAAGGAGNGGEGDGDTTHICAVDGGGMAVSLTQSNALGFGAHIVAGATGIFLHDRGLGFSLEPGHPAELAPGRRPPHTLSPAMVTRPDGSLAHAVGTMGGDAQPQIILQIIARLLHAGEGAGAAVAAPRVTLEAPAAGPFRLWHGHDLGVRVEGHAPADWAPELRRRGHTVVELEPYTQAVGCAQAISAGPPDAAGTIVLAGGSDPRSPEGGAVGC